MRKYVGGALDPNNAYFAYDGAIRLYILTPPSSLHAQYVEARPSVAVAIRILSRPVMAVREVSRRLASFGWLRKMPWRED